MRKLNNYQPTRFMAPDSHYDKAKADKAVAFIGLLTHSKGIWAGKPFELIDWQEQIIRDLMGIVKPDGYRQFTTAYVECPKKQGKSELAAAIALYLLCADGEQSAEVYSAAADRQQASIIFNVACSMVRNNETLSRHIKIIESQKRMIFQPTNSVYAVLSKEARAHSGYNISGLCFDELFCQPDDKLFHMLTKGTGDARKQPLHFLISTAGDNLNSICYQVHQKAEDIIAGRQHDPTFYPVLYGAAMDDDWTDPEVWKRCNPSLGVTVDIEKVRAACESAKQNPVEEHSFRQLRLCQWQTTSIRWMQMERWDACAFPIDPERLRGRPCYGGLDLASTADLTALSLVFPPQSSDERYSILPFCWIPEETVDLRSRRDHVLYDLWKKKGFIYTTDGSVVDYDYIEQSILDLKEQYDIREIAYDRWNATQLVQHLTDEGLTMVPFGQGFRDMSPPTKELMRLTLEGRIAHGGHPVLRWCMDNVIVKTDPAGNIKIDKGKATEKVDAAVATVMALDRAIRNENAQAESVYESRGLLFI